MAYLFQKGVIPIPKSSSIENYESINLTLTEQETSEIGNIPQNRLINPPYMKWD